MGQALSATAAPILEIRGRAYPVVLPKLSDPRLHLAATITSLQVIGQIGFHFEVSIAQILLALGTCAVLEIAIAFRSQHVILWPASAMLTGNGVAFVLRVPGTAHGDWWGLRGWWIFVGTAAVSLLSNPFAAVPSVHTCFSLIIGTSCFFLVRRPAIRFIWLLYPCLIVFSIVATGNHFWLDAILGACLAGVALGVAWTIERFHPTLPASARHRLRLDPAS